MLHPELVKRRRPPKGPIKRRLPGPEWNCDLPWFEYELPGRAWKGHGWMLTADLGRRRITPTCIAAGSQVFEGRAPAELPLRPSAAVRASLAAVVPLLRSSGRPGRVQR